MGTTPDPYFETIAEAHREYLAEMAALEREMETAQKVASRNFILGKAEASAKEKRKITEARRARNKAMKACRPPKRDYDAKRRDACSPA